MFNTWSDHQLVCDRHHEFAELQLTRSGPDLSKKNQIQEERIIKSECLPDLTQFKTDPNLSAVILKNSLSPETLAELSVVCTSEVIYPEISFKNIDSQRSHLERSLQSKLVRKWKLSNSSAQAVAHVLTASVYGLFEAGLITSSCDLTLSHKTYLIATEPSFHLDAVAFHAIGTLAGQTTKWLRKEDVIWDVESERSGIFQVLSPALIQELAVGDIAVFRGSRPSSCKGFIHAAPKTKENRIFCDIQIR